MLKGPKFNFKQNRKKKREENLDFPRPFTPWELMSRTEKPIIIVCGIHVRFSYEPFSLQPFCFPTRPDDVTTSSAAVITRSGQQYLDQGKPRLS